MSNGINNLLVSSGCRWRPGDDGERRHFNSLSSGNLEGSVSTMCCYPLQAKGTDQFKKVDVKWSVGAHLVCW